MTFQGVDDDDGLGWLYRGAESPVLYRYECLSCESQYHFWSLDP